MSYVKFIAVTGDGVFGFYGNGVSEETAIATLRKAAKKKIAMSKIKIVKFTSELPFAPSDREATAEESDAYISKDGSVNWVRCEREWLGDWASTHAKEKGSCTIGKSTAPI